LGEGLQEHFENNDLLQQIFEISLDKSAKKPQLSAIEKRMYMSPNSPLSKVRTQNMNKQRNYKSTVFVSETDSSDPVSS